MGKPHQLLVLALARGVHPSETRLLLVVNRQMPHDVENLTDYLLPERFQFAVDVVSQVQKHIVVAELFDDFDHRGNLVHIHIVSQLFVLGEADNIILGFGVAEEPVPALCHAHNRLLLEKLLKL